MAQFVSPDDGGLGMRGTPVRGLARLLNWAGAMVSIGLVAGLTVWGWRLTVRDVSGVPVIRALEGPMRVAPEDPGGREVAHQGLAVNRVAAEGIAQPLPETIVLAPRPLDIAEEDGPVRPPADPRPIPSALPADPAVAPPLPEEEGTVTDVLLDLAGEEGASDPALTAAGGPEAGEAAAPGDTILPIEVPPGALARSIRPAPRPGGAGGPAGALPGGIDPVAEALARSAAAALAPQGPAEIDPATLAPGTRLVQLGAYEDAAAARAAWEEVAARFGALLEGRARVLQTAESGGRSFVRLRVHGFADEADARRFCAALRAENTPCTPVLLR